MSNNIVSLKAKRPNMLFEQWLTEWMQQASEPKRKCYESALHALQKFPLPLSTGKECLILKGFGEKLCKQLDEKLRQHQNPSSTTMRPLILVNNVQLTENNADAIDLQNDVDIEIVRAPQAQKPKQPNIKPTTVGTKPSKAYCPAYRSGGYAILCALYKFYMENSGLKTNFISKQDLIAIAQEVCDKSFTKKDQGCLYTAWSSMSTLVTKQLVRKEGNPAKFQLTEAGIEVAKPLYNDAISDAQNENFVKHLKDLIEQEAVKLCDKPSKKTKITKNPSSSSLQGSSKTSVNATQETFICPPGTFNIMLIVDKQETSGSTKKDCYDEILIELNNLCVSYEIRHLKIGDYAWICKHLETDKELVLPYIIERKRMDDFGASIKDGRFHEQKFRLKQSGIQNLIYLVESHGNNSHCGMPLSSIYQAATNTLIQDKFSVKFTDNIRKTAEYLGMMTNLLSRIFAKKTLMNCPKDDLQNCDLSNDLVGLMCFKEFNLSSSKNKTMKVSDMFVKQLLQLHGLSVDKALAIVSKYPTPRLLKNAYESCKSEKEAEAMLANVEFGTLNKKIGSVISTTIYQLYNFKNY